MPRPDPHEGPRIRNWLSVGHVLDGGRIEQFAVEPDDAGDAKIRPSRPGRHPTV